MFQRYTRDKRARGRGTGLGLYISKKLTTEMGGTIGYRPNELDGLQKGSIFWIQVPVHSHEDGTEEFSFLESGWGLDYSDSAFGHETSNKSVVSAAPPKPLSAMEPASVLM